MTARWTDDQFKIARRANHPAQRDAGRSPGRTHAERTAHAGVGPHSAAESPRSAGTHGGRVPLPRPSAVHSRGDWGWLLVALVLMVGGVLFMSCHHEADGSPLCAEASCEVAP